MHSENFLRSGYIKLYQATILSLSGLFLISSCSTNKEPETIVINPLNGVEGEVFLSDFTDDISYIPLDNEIMFQHPNRIETTDELIIIATYPAGIMAYDRQGRFINKIGAKGRGPGEYMFGMYFTVDREKEIIYIYDNKKILVYNTEGIFIREFQVNEPDYVGDIKLFNGLLYLAGGPRFDYDWVVYDTSGNIISYKPNELPRFESGWGSFMGFSLNPNGLNYWNSYNDTIFIIDDESFKPSMYLAQGDFRLPFADFPFEDFGKYFHLMTVVSSHNHIFLTYLLDKAIHTSYINKNNGKQHLIGSDIKMSSFNRPGILNDLDSGPELPVFSYSLEKDEEYLIGWINAHNLKSHVESTVFKTSTPKYPEKKNQLQELVARLDENDNPVLMLVKLKP